MSERSARSNPDRQKLSQWNDISPFVAGTGSLGLEKLDTRIMLPQGRSQKGDS